MLLQGNFKSKHVKHILRPALFIGIAAVIFFELGIIGVRQVTFLNVTSTDNVQGLFEPPQECLDKTKDGYSWSCFRTYFETLTNKISARAAMAEAIKLKSQRTASECHLFAHFIGEENLEKHNFDIGKAFSSCTPGCNDGCFHGVMERYIRNGVDLPNLASKIKSVCDSIGTDYIQKYRCIHGVGHGLFAHSYLSLRDAINTCAAFGSEETEDICMGGLLMENMAQYIELDLDEDQLRKIIPRVCAPIESIAPERMYTCIYDIALGLMDYTGYNVERTERLCEELQQQNHINICKNRLADVIYSQVPSNIDTQKFFENFKEF